MWVFLGSTRAQVSGPPFCSSFPRETTTFTYTRASGPTLEGGGGGGSLAFGSRNFRIDEFSTYGNVGVFSSRIFLFSGPIQSRRLVPRVSVYA